VRYRKTVNAFDFGGRPVGVHAQQYAVLVTDVDQAVYPEYMRSGWGLGRGRGAAGPERVTLTKGEVVRWWAPVRTPPNPSAPLLAGSRWVRVCVARPSSSSARQTRSGWGSATHAWRKVIGWAAAQLACD
jgi:hypothetical protein